ncbi:MAG: hypothetical protein ACLQVD_12910 [Capsulimonadaceae bacterium]
MLQTILEKVMGRRAVSRGKEPGRSWTPELSNKSNVDSEITPADLRNAPQPASTERELELVNLVMARFEDSSKARRIHEREWLLCTAFERGNQWVEWRDATNRLESLVDPNDPYRSYVTSNQVRSLTTKLKARATMSKPDASVKPLTPLPQDVGAAAEGRDILAHYDQLFDRQHQTQNWVDCCLATSTTFLKLVWDPNKEALTSFVDPESGRVVVQSAPIGDIEEIIVPPFEMYADPKARSWDEVGWVIHAKVRSLAAIQEKYGERGYRVRGEVAGSSSSSGYWEGRMDSITGDSYRTTTAERANTATVYEMWERPSARYPRGRLIRVAGRVLLTDPSDLVWPYEKRDAFPFVPLGYQEKFGTLWALNAVHDLVPLQQNLNNILSRLMDRINTDKPTILVPTGAEIGVDAYQSKRNFQKIFYEPGMPPTYQAPPPVNGEWFNALSLLKGLMEDLSGVHEVSNGAVPPGITAGNAIELLQQSDTTQMSEFVGNLESAARQRAEWELALVAQFYQEPRLVGISEEGSPQAALMNARSFENLTSGGQCRVVVTPGSATPKTPAARIQQYMDMAKAGMFAPPMLPVLKMLVDLMGLERSDILTSRIDSAIQQVQQMAPSAAQVQAMKGQQALQQQVQQGQAQAAAHSLKTRGDLAVVQAKAESERQADLRAFERDLMLQAHDKSIPTVSLKGNLDAVGTVDAERLAGLMGSMVAPESPSSDWGTEAFAR